MLLEASSSRGISIIQKINNIMKIGITILTFFQANSQKDISSKIH